MWLADTVRVSRVIHKTAFTFSTKLPGSGDALREWVQTDTFRSAIENLIAGRALPGQLAVVDEFLHVTGLGLGSASGDVVRRMLEAFYQDIREDLISSRQGLVLVGNTGGETLREVRELRAEFAAQAVPTGTQIGVQRLSAEVFSEVALRQGWGAKLQVGSELHVNIELPPAVLNVAKRASTVDSVRAIFRNAAWYAMYGGSGSGKTQLAILIARTFAGAKVWIRLGGPLAAASLVLETALAKLAARQVRQATQEWCKAACTALGPDAVIVLDDLPRTMGDGSLDEILTGLCYACAQTGVRLVTTSSGSVAGGTRANLEGNIHEEPVLGFSDDEIGELFRAYGAPDAFLTSTWFGFVRGTTRRHPLLLVEAARFLQARHWTTDERSFDDLAQGTFASSLDLPTIERIRQTVPTDTTREFLYRLKLSDSPFGLEQVQQVSSVPPPISFPLDHLSAVVGLWVHQDSDRTYVLSPLLSRLSDQNLPKELRKAVHLALANGILEKRQLGPLQGFQAICHFVEGGDADSAAGVLVAAFHSMLGIPDLRDPFGLTAVWADLPLPAEIALQKRIFLRALQVILRHRLGRETRYEAADLERLVAEGELNERCQLVIAGAGAMVATYIGDKDPELAIRSLRRSIKASRRLEVSALRGPEIDLDTGLLTLLWMAAAWMRTEAQYIEWFAAIRDLTSGEVSQWAGLSFAGQASQAVCGGVWTRTADLPEDKRDWAGVVAYLEQLKSWAQEAKVRPLEFAAICNQIIVLAEYQGNLNGADSLASMGLNTFNDSPKSTFSIADTIARQHYYFGNPADAVRWFNIAFTIREAVGPAARVSSLILAGIAAQNFDFDLARRYLEEGVVLAASGSVPARTRITAQGELGILLWGAGRLRDAYAVWNTAVRELIDARKETTEWQTLFQLFGNCTGYFLARAQGLPASGDEIAVPFSGILLRGIKDIHELQKPELDWLLGVQIALLAEAIGAFEDSMEWAARAIIGEGAFRLAAASLLAGALASRALGEQRYDQIIRVAAAIGDLDETFEDFAHLDEEARARRNAHFSARLNLVALTIEIGRICLHDRSRAEDLARAAEALARKYAAQHDGSRLWSGMAEVFGSFRGRSTSWRPLWDKAGEAGRQGSSALQVSYGIAAIAAAGPREAVQIQMQILPWLERHFSPTLYHVTVAKFMPEYWGWAFDQYPMSFGMLNRTRTAIANAQVLDDRARVRAILHAVAFSLAVYVPDEVQRWLDAVEAA